MHKLRTYQAFVIALCSAAAAFPVSAGAGRPPEAVLTNIQSKARAATLYQTSYDATDDIAARRGLDCREVRSGTFAVVAREVIEGGEWSATTNSVTSWYAAYGFSRELADRYRQQCYAIADSYGITNISAWTQGLGRPELDGRQVAESGSRPGTGPGAGGQEQAETGSE